MTRDDALRQRFRKRVDRIALVQLAEWRRDRQGLAPVRPMAWHWAQCVCTKTRPRWARASCAKLGCASIQKLARQKKLRITDSPPWRLLMLAPRPSACNSVNAAEET